MQMYDLLNIILNNDLKWLCFNHFIYIYIISSTQLHELDRIVYIL